MVPLQDGQRFGRREETLYSGIGELLWYLAGTDRLDFVSYYASKYNHNSSDGISVHGAYGPRLLRMRGIDQLASVMQLLKQRPSWTNRLRERRRRFERDP